MLTIKINDHTVFETEKRNNDIFINSKPTAVDVHQINADEFHLISDHKNYRVKIISINKPEKNCIVRVNGNKYTLDIKNQFDLLLQQLGFDNLNSLKVLDLKAPMPGLVLKTLVNKGDQIKKGDSLLVLEAMKMENNIKSPCDLTVKSVKIKAGDIVEKNQILIDFE